jgi:YD repeat-containing protein
LTTYGYVAQNRLIQIDFPDLSVATYLYDGLGRRIEKNVAGTITRYVYDGEDIALEFDGLGTLTADFGHGG